MNPFIYALEVRMGTQDRWVCVLEDKNLQYLAHYGLLTMWQGDWSESRILNRKTGEVISSLEASKHLIEMRPRIRKLFGTPTE